MGNAIEIKNLTKRFGENTAVNHVSLNIPENGIFSLLGVNGAGKTTLIRILSGLLKYDEGSAKVMGLDVSTELNKVKEVINISTQETAVAQNLTVKENLEFIAGIYGMDAQKAKAVVKKVIEDFSFHEVINQRAKTLSGGWQRRLSIAMAAMTHPKVLFLDEPTLGLDVLARRELWNIINKIKKNTTVILTTHYMEEAQALSDYVAIMVKGSIRDTGTVEQLKNRYHASDLESVFVQIAGEEIL